MNLDANGLPVLDQFSEEGFVDCVFAVGNLEHTDGFYGFELLASYRGTKVGFAVRMIDRVEPGFDADMNLIQAHVRRGAVVFQSLGNVSDALVTALGALYDRDAGPRRMVAEESFTLICLQQRDTDLERRAVRMKLFGRDSEPFVEDDYYESFFIVDLAGGFVWWNEKDPDYRSALLRALTMEVA